MEKKAGNRGVGRVKGVPNKVTKELKEMILGALDDAGGQAYLARQAEENPNAFLTLVGKVLPLSIKSESTVTAGYSFTVNRASRDDAQENQT
jgi:hypothetical protein